MPLARRRRGGFTLIEVMGALVIFTGGIMMVMNLASSLNTQLERMALMTDVATTVRAQVDSIAALGWAGVTPGSTQSTVTLRARSYVITRTVSERSPLVREITVAMAPASGYSGPTRSYTTQVATTW